MFQTREQKLAYITSMVAEDLLADKFSDISGKKLYEYMNDDDAEQTKNTGNNESCSDGSSASSAKQCFR